MESSLPVSELELEARSAISKRAEANPALFCFLGYVRIVNVDVVGDCEQRFLLRKRSYEVGRHKSTTPKHRSRVHELFSV
jgi:hypothetical protein